MTAMEAMNVLLDNEKIAFAKLTGTRQYVVHDNGVFFLQYASNIDAMYDSMNDRMAELKDGALDEEWAAWLLENPIEEYDAD